jgi:Putative Actinobacterial Holin-X, holin superfamily III
VGDEFGRKGDVVIGCFGGERDTDSELQTIERPISAIVNEIILHLEEMVRSEVRLAKTEIFDEISRAAKQCAKIAAAVVLFLYAFGFLLLGGMYGLAEAIPLWLAAIVIGVMLAGTGLLLWRKGRRDLSEIRPRLERTTQSLKEDLSWIKKPMP